jgi:hypothetical protein
MSVDEREAKEAEEFRTGPLSVLTTSVKTNSQVYCVGLIYHVRQIYSHTAACRGAQAIEEYSSTSSSSSSGTWDSRNDYVCCIARWRYSLVILACAIYNSPAAAAALQRGLDEQHCSDCVRVRLWGGVT